MTNSNSDRPSEFALIAELFAPLAREARGAFGLADDAAAVAPPPGHEIVITTDMLVAGVHFLEDTPPPSVARKALRVNLSDLAAKGADARGYLMALSLPKSLSMVWLRAFVQGLEEDQEIFGVHLFGGDTTATPGPLTLAITAFGFVPGGTVIRRNGAKPGDRLFVSGTIGDAAQGLALLQNPKRKMPQNTRAFLIGRHREPMPRLALGRALRGIASAALDVSDGLLADVAHIAETSGVRVMVNAAAVPLSNAFVECCGRGDSALAAAVTGGDDYEIAFTVSPPNVDAAQDAAKQSGTAIHEIGFVEEGQGVVFRGKSGRTIPTDRRGYTHF